MLDDHAPKRLRAGIHDLMGHHLGDPSTVPASRFTSTFSPPGSVLRAVEGRQADHEARAVVVHQPGLRRADDLFVHADALPGKQHSVAESPGDPLRGWQR